MDLRCEPARAQDAEAICGLLAGQHLPVDGLRDHLATTIVAREGTTIVGSAALEIYPDGALMRSVAVAPRRQGQGLTGTFRSSASSASVGKRCPNRCERR